MTTNGRTGPAVTADGSPTDGLALVAERARHLIDEPLRQAVKQLVAPVSDVCTYHFGWTEADGSPATGAHGKGLRPVLAILSAEAAGAPPETGIPGAVAVELLHNFSLLHDDVMDGDEQRRHRDTAWKVFGESNAILAGDALFSLAYELLLTQGTPHGADAARQLAASARLLIDGQAQDLAFEGRDHVSVEEYLEMAGNKTGALFACAASIGAVLGGADQHVVRALAEYGRQLGLAFQATDDVLGVWGDAAVTGKSARTDLVRRKKTLPVVAALAAGGPASTALAARLTADTEDHVALDDEECARRLALVEQAGGRALATAEAGRRHALAVRALEEISLPPLVREQLTALAAGMTARRK